MPDWAPERMSAGTFRLRTPTHNTYAGADAFFRSHRGYLVNVGRIVEIQPGDAGTFVIRMRDDPDSAIPLSRRQARKLKERIPW